MVEYENLGKVNMPFFEDYKKCFSDTLNSGWYILGNKVKKFEEEFAEYVGSNFCIGVASGLDALFLSLKAFDFDSGSEVIVPANTYIATILSILDCGLQPVLVEPDIRTYNIDPQKIEERITGKTVAIMVVHLYGKPCDMNPIVNLTQKYGLKLIEDCAQAHGAVYKGKKIGAFGDTGAFSFYPTKNLGALGDAGAVTTNNLEIAEKIKKLRNYGSTIRYHNDYIGFNSRLDEVQAGFLSIKLKKLDKINLHKRDLAHIYLEGLKSDFIKPLVDEDYFDVYHIFNVRHPYRNSLKEYLLNNDIKTEIHYPIPPHRQKALAGMIDKYDYPVADEIHNTTLSLPISYFHTTNDINKVVEVMNRF